jgi:hypothetical protein
MLSRQTAGDRGARVCQGGASPPIWVTRPIEIRNFQKFCSTLGRSTPTHVGSGVGGFPRFSLGGRGQSPTAIWAFWGTWRKRHMRNLSEEWDWSFWYGFVTGIAITVILSMLPL